MTPLDHTEDAIHSPHPASERAGASPPSVGDLPYGPLPVRAEQSRPSQPAFPGPDPNAEQPGPLGEPPRASELEIPDARREVDDDVHFGVAAKALGVSRKTVERLVKRGQLERGPSGTQATVSKRSLVAALEERRRDVGHLTRATEIAQRQSGVESMSEAWSVDAATELQELLRPVLEPLLEEFVAARSRAAVLESQIEMFAAQADQERGRDELLLALATGGWRSRRKARKDALRHFLLRDRFPPPSP